MNTADTSFQQTIASHHIKLTKKRQKPFEPDTTFNVFLLGLQIRDFNLLQEKLLPK